MTALADLVKPGLREPEVHDEDDDDDDDERQILTDAGIISAGTRGSKTGQARQTPKHIIFVDTEEEGEFVPIMIFFYLFTSISAKI